MRSTDAGALMHVAATTVEALIVVLGHGPSSQQAALSHIVAVDPPSANVQLKEVCNLLCLIVWVVGEYCASDGP